MEVDYKVFRYSDRNTGVILPGGNIGICAKRPVLWEKVMICLERWKKIRRLVKYLKSLCFRGKLGILFLETA